MRKKAKTKIEATAPAPAPPARIRMLMSLGTAQRPYWAGDVVEVGKDVSAETALNWIRCGAAEEDGSITRAPETK